MEQHEVNTAREVVCRCEEVTREELLEAMRLGADSLDIVELIMALEDAFDVEIPDSDAEKIATVGDAVEYVKSLK